MKNKIGFALGIVLGAVLSGCTMASGVVKDVHLDSAGKLEMTKCDLTYVALYTMIVREENCKNSEVK